MRMVRIVCGAVESRVTEELKMSGVSGYLNFQSAKGVQGVSTVISEVS